jgi:hypothetical protein
MTVIKFPYAAKNGTPEQRHAAVLPPPVDIGHHFTTLFSTSFFKLPFVTLPSEECDTWGEFWKRVDMWNDEPTNDPCADHSRGRQYARASVEAIVAEGASIRQLEIVVERMIEKAYVIDLSDDPPSTLRVVSPDAR